MNRKTLLFLSLFLITVFVSCEKEDDTDKLTANPLYYEEADAAATFNVYTGISISLYYVYGNKPRKYEIDAVLPAGAATEFIAAGTSIPAASGVVDYEGYQSVDSSMRVLFGQEATYSLNSAAGEIFSTTLRGPDPIQMNGPTNHPMAPSIEVSRNTMLTWNPDPTNTYGMVVAVSTNKKTRYLRIADDGSLTLNSIWSRLPLNASFVIGLYRGTHTTVTGNDGKKYIINVISVSTSHSYVTKGI